MNRRMIEPMQAFIEQNEIDDGILVELIQKSFKKTFGKRPAGIDLSKFPGEIGANVWVDKDPTSRMKVWRSRVSRDLQDAGFPVIVIVRNVQEQEIEGDDLTK